MSFHQVHKSSKTGWLRASVLGANDGIISIASLIIGLAAANAAHQEILIAGVAGLVAGTMSMAAGEYVSVSSQSDTEKADLLIEQKSLEENYDFELKELAEIYQKRGLSNEFSFQVAKELMEHDALGAHARDEIGISEIVNTNPIQAAFSSAIAFIIGGILPLIVIWFSAVDTIISSTAIFSLVFLASLGILAAKIGGASLLKGAFRVSFWGALAMLVTAIVGKIFGVII